MAMLHSNIWAKPWSNISLLCESGKKFLRVSRTEINNRFYYLYVSETVGRNEDKM